MAIDPVRLARIRARLLAASALAVPACGGASEHVNERPREQVYVNEARPDDKPVDSPINDRGNDPPVQTHPTAPNVNRPEPDVNQPKPDTTTSVAPTPTPNDIPPPGQTINVATAEPATINTVQRKPLLPPSQKKDPKPNVNTPEPFNPR